MEKILLTTGLACLIAGIIGGGLKAFGIEIPVLKTWPRQLALLLFGGLLCLIAIEMRPKLVRSSPTVQAPKQEIAIHFAQRGGPFVELGPAKKHPLKDYWWHAMDIRVENHCTKPIHIDPVDFRLYLASTASTNGAERYSPEVITQYSGRLPAGWLKPGKSTEGSLIFQVPNRLPNGINSNGAYHIVRSSIKSQCNLTYKPY